jgi:small subunit ribosomal protein S27Ae
MSKYFKVDGDSLKSNFETCPKCGPGYFMGKHSDRTVCGHCGHTEFAGTKKRRKKSKK